MLEKVAIVAAAAFLALAGCNRANAVDGAPEVPLPTLLSHLPESIRYEPQAPAPERNAWLATAKGYLETPRFGVDELELLERELSGPTGPSSPEARAKVERILETFRPYLEATEKGLAVGKSVIVAHDHSHETIKTVQGLRTHVTLFLRRAALKMADGEVDQALGDYRTALRIASQLSGSGGSMDYAIVGTSLYARAFREIRWAACHPKMTPSGLNAALAMLPQPKDLREEFRASIKSELYWFVRNEVQRLKGPGANSLVKRDADETKRDSTSGWDRADELAALVLDGHDEPFDRESTVRSAEAIYSAISENLDREWDKQQPVEPLIWELIKDWPENRLRGAVAEGKEGEKEVATAKAALASAENPYGKFAVWFFQPVSLQSGQAPFQVQSDVSATRLVLALRLHKATQGAFPKALEELTWIPEVAKLPADPFSGKSFHYSTKDEKIWSVGRNARDDGGVGALPSISNKMDFVWHFGDLKEPARTVSQNPGFVSGKPRPMQGSMSPR